MNDAQTPFELTFTQWECGHHQQRPAPIPVSSPAQARLILQAIASAISQPGSARGVLVHKRRTVGTAVYVTDDYVGDFPLDPSVWSHCPDVICGDEATITAILSDELERARVESMPLGLELVGTQRWDGRTAVGASEVILTTLTREQIEESIRAAADEWPPRDPVFELPPTFHDASQVLAELRGEEAAIAAYWADLADDRHLDHLEVSIERPGALSNLPHDGCAS